MASFGRQILTRLRLIIGWVAELLHAMIVPIWGLRPLVASFGRQIPGWLRLIVDGGFQFSRAIVALIWGFGRWTVRIAGLLAIVYIFAFYVLDTPKDVAYRYSVPESEACKTQWRKANVLAPKRIEKKTGMFLDKGNDEITATASDPEIKTNKAFTCMLQKHVLYPPTNALKQPQPVFTRDRPISYNLAFLEFSEDGTPAEEGADGKKIMPENPGKDCSIERGGRSLPENCQLAAVIKHLSQNEKLQNFVMVFIHGWRHDASIGDDNVKDVRVYAAHLASFLDYRCHVMKRYCNAAVTAIYIGWRGARVNEQALTQVFEAWGAKLIGVSLGNLLAFPTLFDRKPVSERVAPAAISALRAIYEVLNQRNNGKDFFSRDRMIIFGHSLGGNMIASALKDQMIELIRHHEPGTKLKSPIGDLIVLLNPASEANNWTMLQRTTKQRGNPQSAEGDALYPIDQPPIYVSLSAAAIWPAGGLRETDIRLMREIEKRDPKYDPKMTDCDVIHKRYEEYNDRADYDWATHDLFPAFRGDFRPAAETLDRLKDSCMEGPHLTTRPPMASVMAVVAAFLRNIPFMNTDFEQTRTIGQLDPFRPPFGVYNSGLPHAATQVGTTHELSINLPKRHAETDRIKPRDAIEDTVYGNAADPYLSECDIVDHWLWKARARQQVRFPLGKPWSKGDFWDSGYSTTDLQDYIVSGDQCQPNLTPVRQRAIWAAGHVESQFRHGLQKAGMDPIISANDPFWNIRAVDNGLHAHSGYVSYPLICAIHQLVMDDVASKPSDQYTIEKDCRERLLPGIGNDEADRK